MDSLRKAPKYCKGVKRLEFFDILYKLFNMDETIKFAEDAKKLAEQNNIKNPIQFLEMLYLFQEPGIGRPAFREKDGPLILAIKSNPAFAPGEAEQLLDQIIVSEAIILGIIGLAFGHHSPRNIKISVNTVRGMVKQVRNNLNY